MHAAAPAPGDPRRSAHDQAIDAALAALPPYFGEPEQYRRDVEQMLLAAESAYLEAIRAELLQELGLAAHEAAAANTELSAATDGISDLVTSDAASAAFQRVADAADRAAGRTRRKW